MSLENYKCDGQIEISEFIAEEWKVIEGYDGKYKVSNCGRVLSVARKVNNHTGIIKKKDYFVTQRKDAKGYLRVYLDLNGKTKYTPVHRLVAKAFIPNEQNKPQVNHIDGDKTNNRASNLEWCTNKENQIHAVKLGLNDHSRYECGKKKRPVLQIDAKTGDVIKEHPSIADASRAIGHKSNGNIGECCRGNRKTVGGFLWKYKGVV